MSTDNDQRPSLRSQQQQLARELILQALLDVVMEEGVHAFTVQRVAERAGVSHRTVYRHFPTRQALLDGLGDWTAEHNRQIGLGVPDRLEELPDHVRRIFAQWDSEEALVRAFVLLRLTTGMQERARTERTQLMRAMLRDWAPNVDEATHQRASYALRTLVGTATWAQMRDDFGVSGAEAGEAVAYVLQLILDDLKRREAAARAAAEERESL